MADKEKQTMPLTYKRAAELALQCQDACNSSGVLISLNEIMLTVIRPEAEKLGHGTRWINQHPIVYMFLYKLMALNGHEPLSDWDTYNQMEKACQAIVDSAEIAERLVDIGLITEVKEAAKEGK